MKGSFVSRAMDVTDLLREGKISRFFRAKRKLNIPNLVSHITQRAAGKELLFVENRDYLSMLVLLKEVMNHYSVRLYSFCLMPNHLHLLLKPQEANLDSVMRDLFSRYATMFNRKYERRGHLFAGPYRQSVCLDDAYLLSASVYIHLNPVRAGIVARASDYRWSSCSLFCKLDPPKSFIDRNFILKLLHGQKGDRVRQYRELLSESVNMKPGEVFQDPDALERFNLELSSKWPSIFKDLTKKRQIVKASGIDITAIDELEKAARDLRKGPANSGPETREAKRFLVEQMLARGYKRKEVALKLGISRKTVYNILQSYTLRT